MHPQAHKPVSVMLLGAGGNAGLNYAKCLALVPDRYRIVACDIDPYNLAAARCDARYLVPKSTDAARLDALNRIIERENVAFAHAQPDPEVRFLAEHSLELHAPTLGLRKEILGLCSDKLRCQALWRTQLGLYFEVASLAELRADARLFEHLCARSGKAWVRATSGAGSRAALPVTTIDQAMNWAQYWMEVRGLHEHDFMVAEFLSGPEYAVQTFWVEGELLHAQARERLVYFFGSVMPSGQSSTPAVAVTVSDRDVYDVAYAAVGCVDAAPHGIYCVDLKRNAAGRVIPMEINYGRFFTTSDFFARLGVNTPHAVIEYVLGGVLDRRVETVGPGWYWLRGLDREPMLTDDPRAEITAADGLGPLGE